MASKASKRRRKRRGGAAVAPGPELPQRPGRPDRSVATARRRNVDDEPPPAPWGSFPLIELTVLVGIVMLVAGFVFVEGQRSRILVLTGLALASIGGLEVSIREHFAGYRSHTLVLAGVPAVATLAILFYAGPDALPVLARAAIALAVFAAAAYLLTLVFRSRSGGYAFRLSGLRRR